MVHLLIATVPSRRDSARRLLAALSEQSLQPDVVHLRLDGYGDAPGPDVPARLAGRVRETRTAAPVGPGGRWSVLPEVPPDATLVVLDDDVVLCQPGVVEVLVSCAAGGAAAHQGFRVDGVPGPSSRGWMLACMGAATMAVGRAGDLEGLEATAREVQEKCGFDPFGDLGDDEAVVSAHLWRRGVPMRATGPLGIGVDTGAQPSSQTSRRRTRDAGRDFFWQRREIARVTGWPWRP